MTACALPLAAPIPARALVKALDIDILNVLVEADVLTEAGSGSRIDFQPGWASRGTSGSTGVPNSSAVCLGETSVAATRGVRRRSHPPL